MTQVYILFSLHEIESRILMYTMANRFGNVNLKPRYTVVKLRCHLLAHCLVTKLEITMLPWRLNNMFSQLM